MNPTYHALAGPNWSIWAIDDARHVRGLATHPEDYERRVVGFFDAALPPTSPGLWADAGRGCGNPHSRVRPWPR